MGEGFSFKQFSIRQDRCGMKVGTDGVLLGAWATGGDNILDIGTGTGLIALMMAQRFAHARVTAIDIDTGACRQARENADESPFKERIEIKNHSLQLFTSGHVESGAKPFDAIVCNPPFFTSELKSPSAQRSLARHADTLPYSDLFACTRLLLSDGGAFSAIIPYNYLDDFISESAMHGLFLSADVAIKTVAVKTPKRHLVAFGKHRSENVDRRIECLSTANGARSQWYDDLTKDFYLEKDRTSSNDPRQERQLRLLRRR